MKPYSQSNRRNRFLSLVKESLRENAFIKLILSRPAPATQSTLKRLHIRPVCLKNGTRLSFTFKHTTSDITKNYTPAAGFKLIYRLIGTVFLNAHLLTKQQTAQLQISPRWGRPSFSLKNIDAPACIPDTSHDIAKHYLIPSDTQWLQDLGITNSQHRPQIGMSDKFRQIQKFVELLQQLTEEADLKPSSRTPLSIYDMGAGKGYLTFGIAELFGNKARIIGIESRPALVELCNRMARKNNFSNLCFEAGRIDSFKLPPLDILVALHACDTATDDAIAQGIAANARLIICSPCCQKELRPQLRPPEVLHEALRHGIFRERQTEFVTDALRAMLLDWAGYQVKVFEFISHEHTAKNLMLSAIKAQQAPGEARKKAIAQSIQAFAAFYGIQRQQLASHLGFSLTG